MADDIIEIDDYEVKDKQILETDDEDSQSQYDNQREYDQDYNNQGGFSGYYKSISLNNTSLLIILMVIVLLIAIFIMTFD